ncbi:DnaD domain protein [Clostridium felsineum]|uniref:DnaD domain protein n=1 Tax=Clostridium felsineum TaxID=36839 RepID=UPI00214DC995|nr:DnaD domain protein [Clostridium felsineum]MCR3758906.1 DnaD domain protein [Clostridium felsineum]
MSQTVIRVEKRQSYVVMNKEALQNNNLSWKAKGLLAYLLSLPDNWQIYVDELSKHSRDGRDSTLTALKELIKARYIYREQIRGSNGKFGRYRYVVYESPKNVDITNISPQTEKPYTGNPEAEKPKSENPELLNNNILNTNKLNNNLNIKEEETCDKRVIILYRKCISKNISDFEYEKLIELEKAYGIELLSKAIEIAACKNAKNINYISVVLSDWNGKGLKTNDDVDLHLAKWLKDNQTAKENKEHELKRRSDRKKAYTTKQDNFNDYEQRKYDYKELERKLLGWEDEECDGS